MYVMRRSAHVVRTRKRTTLPDNILCFDTETRVIGNKPGDNIGRNVLWFGWTYGYRNEKGVISREVWSRFTTPEQFFQIVKGRSLEGKPLFVYAHNLGFDLPIVGFFERLKIEGFEVAFYTFDSPPNIFKCTWNKRTIVFVDTLNYWQTSLAKIGHSLGIDKLNIPLTSRNKKEWDIYCKRDVQVVAAAMNKLFEFVRKHDCGGVGLTAASLAMNAFKFRFMKHEIYIHDRLRVCELERSSYYGGYVNTFFIGRVSSGRVYKLDINSHYPAVMLGNFPTKLVEEIDKPTIQRLSILNRQYITIADVELKTKEPFPFRGKNRKLNYVVGHFRTVLSSPEIERAIRTKSITKIHKLVAYEKAPIFRDYVNYFWNLRQRLKAQDQHVEETFCKLLLNSLYGKWGQRGVSWVDFTKELAEYIMQLSKDKNGNFVYDPSSIPMEIVGYQSWTPFGMEEEYYLRNIVDRLQIKLPIGEHHESFPAIAALVTSYGREKLLNLISIAGRRNVYYCDTDSLFTNRQGYLNLKKARQISAIELGKLKVEATSTKLEIRGLKDYTFGDTTKIKGIRQDAEKVGPNEFEQIQFEGIKGVLRRKGKDDGKPGEAFILVKKIRKKLKREYDKGVILPSGWVEPIRKRLT